MLRVRTEARVLRVREASKQAIGPRTPVANNALVSMGPTSGTWYLKPRKRTVPCLVASVSKRKITTLTGTLQASKLKNEMFLVQGNTTNHSGQSANSKQLERYVEEPDSHE